MAKKLKDVNKDGKVNFKDTWLGERLSTKGKLKGPNLAESLKGARRVSDKPATESKPTSKAASKPVPKPKPRPASLDATSGASRSVEGKVKAKAAVGGRGDGAAEVERRRKDRLAEETQRTALKSVGPIGGKLSSSPESRFFSGQMNRKMTKDTARPSFDVDYDQWLKMTPAKRKELGLPATYGAIQRMLGTKMKTQTKNRFKFYNRED
jgi:hypothetical protein